MRKFTRIRKLRRYLKGGNKDFSNMDLSDLDLSRFVPELWEDAIFYNTNFKGTGINFLPSKLRNESVEGCNFEGVDLSEIPSEEWTFINIKNANFRKTNVNIIFDHIFKDIEDILIDESYGNKPREYWNRTKLNFIILEHNPFIKITSIKLISMIKKYIAGITIFLSDEKVKEIVSECEEKLRVYDDGNLIRFYDLICINCTAREKLDFFRGNIIRRCFKKLDFTGFSTELIQEFNFRECKFGEIILSNEIDDIIHSYIRIFNRENKNEFGKIILTKFDGLNSWKNYLRSTIMGRITVKRFLYLEIGKKCNSNCVFCRNKSFEECKERNFQQILENLKIISKYMDTIFIGGGEPALYLQDIIEIYKCIGMETDIVIVSNGTICKKDLKYLDDEIGVRNVSLYISRHAISEEDNKNILNVSKNVYIMSANEIKEMSNIVNIVLTPVCVKGGLDTSEKIKAYIEEFLQEDIKSITFATLHANASLGTKKLEYEDLYVSPDTFEDVYKELLRQDFVCKEEISSTGGYILKRFQKGNYMVSFKIYITMDELKEIWDKTIKKTWDFTMTPSGDVYQDWNRGKLVDLTDL